MLKVTKTITNQS